MLSRQQIANSVLWACKQEVNAPKPGNINCFSAAYEMEVADFIASAQIVAPVMASPSLSVGQCILQSVQATRQVVNCNTNLGIILLFAPLCVAIRGAGQTAEIPALLSGVLSSLTVEDARLAYQAIRLAEAGGLGKAARQDINDDPTVTLLQAMQLAAQRDSIAHQYCHNFRDIFALSLPALTQALAMGQTIEWASAFAYLKLLSEIPDSLIRRKQSDDSAQTVTKKARQFVLKMCKNNNLREFKAELAVWDAELKQKALNPGTTADIIAATLLLYQFEQQLSADRISVP